MSLTRGAKQVIALLYSVSCSSICFPTQCVDHPSWDWSISYWGMDEVYWIHKSLCCAGEQKVNWDKGCKTYKWQVPGPQSPILPYSTSSLFFQTQLQECHACNRSNGGQSIAQVPTVDGGGGKAGGTHDKAWISSSREVSNPSSCKLPASPSQLVGVLTMQQTACFPPLQGAPSQSPCHYSPASLPAQSES